MRLKGDDNVTMVAERVWTKEEIQELLATSDKMVKRSLVKIFEKQTEDEQQSDDTRHNNGVGFNGLDARILSSFAKQVIERDSLSPKQMAIARNKMKKYAGQIAKIANGQL